MIKTSVIIPVYNVEKYLPRCLDSVINQTLKEIEIICINDESPDNCDKILSEYAKSDKRIIVLNQKNSGQGSARNRGLEIAKGKYIQFLDSDDYYEPNCCEEMYNLMENHKDIDVACFDTNIIYEAYEDKKENDKQYFNMKYKGKTKIRPHMAHQLIDVNCWNKIFRKSFIDSCNLRFPEKLHYEDVGFFWFWITRTKDAYFYRKKLTNYVRRKGSFLGEIYEKSSKTIFDAFKVNELIYEDLVENNKWEEYKSTYMKSYIEKFRWLINCFEDNNIKDKRTLINNCSDFLSGFHKYDLNMPLNYMKTFDNIINKNYYSFNAFNRYDTERIHPIFNNHSINLVFSTDKNYIPYLAVTIASIIENSSLENNYDIIILYQDTYDYQKRFILSLVEKYQSISIRFFNMTDYIKKFGINELFTVNHITISAYFRLFVGKIFAEYKRILYLDCDLITTVDIAKLFLTNIGEYPVAAALDTTISYSLTAGGLNISAWKAFSEYMNNTLGFTSQDKYFNSGVMIIDIEKFNEIDLDYLIDLAKRNNKFFHDQNVLNVAFEGNYFELSPTWNFQWNIKFHSIDYKDILPSNILAFYEDPDIHAKIIHYTSHEKPWKNPHHTFANIWWEYARKTPFYEILLKDLCKNGSTPVLNNSSVDAKQLKDMINYNRDKRLYLKYKILSKITFGKTRQKYRQLKKDIKWHLKGVKQMISKI